jgi:hypothetical protein
MLTMLVTVNVLLNLLNLFTLMMEAMLVAANVIPSSPILFTLIMEAHSKYYMK